jgi:diaminopimelate decarboxylase
MGTAIDTFTYRDGQLHCEDVPVAKLADQFGTPLYVYSQNAILGTLNALKSAFAEVEPLICYSVKANSNLGILKVMAEHDSAFDVVSE